MLRERPARSHLKNTMQARSAGYESARMQGENARRWIRCDTASTFSSEDDAIS